MSSDNKRLTKKGQSVKIPAWSSDVHFNTLYITALTCEVVFAVVIIAKDSTLTYGKLYGFDSDAV